VVIAAARNGCYSSWCGICLYGSASFRNGTVISEKVEAIKKQGYKL
jgi:hypothetical protein